MFKEDQTVGISPILKLNSPKFSVIMANYNNGKYIQEAIESVILQKFSDWELLIMDDGSTDDSIARIKEYLGDDRIFFMKNSSNKGKVICLLELVSRSRAEFFGILDSDDVLGEEALSCMYDAHMKHQNCGFIYSQFEFCDSSMNPICCGFCRSLPEEETNLRDIYSSAFRTFKKDSYNKTEGYNEKFIYGQDRDMVFKMEEVTNLLFVDKVLYKHRVLSDSISNDPKKKPLGHLLLIQAQYDAFYRRSGTQIPNLTKKEMSVELCIASVLCLRIKKRKKMIKYLKRAIVLNPILFFSMINYLFKKIQKKIKSLFRPSTASAQFKYRKVSKEIRRQLSTT